MEHQEASRLPQYLAALIVNIGAFIFGMSLGWTSPTEKLLEEGQYGFSVSEVQFTWISSIMPIGALLAAPVVGWMVTTFGRKTSILALCIPSAIGYALMTWAKNVAMFYVGRLLTGIATGGFSVVVPMYLGEYAQTHIRGTLGTYFQLYLSSGILFTYIVGAVVDVFWLTLLCTLLPIICFVLMFIPPESPVYFLEKNRVDEAKKALQWFRGSHYDIECEYATMLENINREKAEKLTFFQAFSTRAAKKALIINMGLMAFQQLSGFNGVIFYTTTIFEAAGSNLSSSVQTIITGVVAVVVTYFSTFAVDSLGRRPLLLVSDFIMAICTFIIGLFFFLKDRGYSVSSFDWAPLAFVCIFLVAFAFGFGPVPWVILGETFPRQISGYAVSLACSFNFLFVFLVTYFFSDVSSAIGMGGTFFVFTVLSASGTLFVFFLVPETKNKTLEEMLKELGQ